MTHSKPSAKLLKDYQAPSFFIDNVNLEFDLQDANTLVTAITSVRKNPDSSNTDLFLDGIDLELIAVQINGLNFEHFSKSAAGLTLQNVPDTFELKIITKIDPLNNSSLEGLYLSGGAFCTQCEAEGFRKITYYPDRPDVLATFEVKIIADNEYPYLLSNGNKVEQGKLDNGRHYAIWQDPYKKPCYLFALVAGDFDVHKDEYITMSGRKIALELFVDKGNLSKAPHALASLKKAMKWDEDTFGLEYDLDIYMIVAVDFFNMGAMENKGLNVFNSKCVLASKETATDTDYHTIESIIGHEYFHNWTGNRVTCRDWFQLSLKEGLTVFRDQEFSADMGSKAINRISAVKVMRTHQFAEDSGPMSHPIRPEKVIEMNNFYTVTVYDKGAEVIRMMHTLLGKDKFRKGMDLYFQRHDGQAVTCDDFVKAMADASGIDLNQFKYWYSQSGTPELTVSDHFDELTKQYTLTITQMHKATADQTTKKMLHIPFSIELLDTQGKPIELWFNEKPVNKVLNLKQEKQHFVFDNMNEKPVAVLLENFSAPCKLICEYTDEQLIHIVKHASSDFSRWDAQQMLFTNIFMKAITHGSNKLDIQVLDLLKSVLNDPLIDKELAAELLKLPSFETLSAAYNPVPIERLLELTDSYEHQIVQYLFDDFKKVYLAQQDNDELDAGSVAKRALKNMCLFYLAKAPNETDTVNRFLQEQSQSTNMTNSLAALNAVVQSSHILTESLLNSFAEKWQHDVLVMDKWFAMNAMLNRDNIIQHITKLYQHPNFDIANPNRVRALVSNFTHFNIKHFHHISGSGYILLTELLIKLDKINPQNASRMITPLLSWKRYDPTRQQLILAQLKKLNSIEGISDDLFEKVEKALN